MLQRFLLTRNASFFFSFAVFLAGFAFSAVFVVFLAVMDYDHVAAMRDRVLSDVPEAGIYSDLGIALMFCAALYSLLHGITLRRTPLFILGVFCLMFASDDAFLIHEAFGRFEAVFFAVYTCLLVFLLHMFKAKDQPLPWPLLVALLAFGASVMLDTLWDHVETVIRLVVPGSDTAVHAVYILEDVFKFCGICVLSSFAMGEALLASISKSVRRDGIIGASITG